jgi:hypothetical protein
MASSSAGCGRASRMMTVWASGVSTVETGSSMVWNGWLALITPIEKATSSAVSGCPSWKTASSTRWSVTLKLSGAIVQDFAR